jgi:dihydrofolate reductase
MGAGGRLIYGMNVSLDGFVATPDGGLDWATVDEDVHRWWNDQLRGAAGSLYGRRIYEVMAGHWPTAEADPAISDVERDFARVWNPMPKVVFSTTLDAVIDGARLVRGDAREVLAEVRRDLEGDLDVSGPNLAGQFVRAGLVDEFQLVIHPVVLGAGIPFWPSLEEPLRLRLVDAHDFASGVVLRSYVPA